MLSVGRSPVSDRRWLYRKNAPAAMATIPAASPSSPSIRLTALVMTTHPQHREQRLEVRRTGDEAGERHLEEEHRHAEQVRARSLRTPARRPWPAPTPRGCRRAGRPRRWPTRRAPHRGVRSSAGRRPGTPPSGTRPPCATRKATNIAAPPAVGVGSLWTLRSDRASMTPHRTASRRAANVSTQLARAETARMTPYPTTVPDRPRPPSGRGAVGRELGAEHGDFVADRRARSGSSARDPPAPLPHRGPAR